MGTTVGYKLTFYLAAGEDTKDPLQQISEHKNPKSRKVEFGGFLNATHEGDTWPWGPQDMACGIDALLKSRTDHPKLPRIAAEKLLEK